MKLREIEQRELLDAVQKVKDQRNLRQVEMLSHLHRAAEATRNRFHDALANYHDRNNTILHSSDAGQDPEDVEEWYGAERQDTSYGVPSPSQYGGRGSPQLLFGGSSSASSPYGGRVAQNLLQQQLQQHVESLQQQQQQQQQQQLPEMSSRPVFGMRPRSFAHPSAGNPQVQIHAMPAFSKANLGLQQAIRRTHSGGMLQFPTAPARSRDRSESPERRFNGSLPAPLRSIFAEADSPLPAFAPAATAHAAWRQSEARTSSPSPPLGYPAMPGQGMRGSSVGPGQSSVLGRVPSSVALEPLELGTQTLKPPPEGEEVPPFLRQSLSCSALNSPLAGSPQACGAAGGQTLEQQEPAHKRGLARLGGSRLQRSFHADLGDETRQFCVIPFRSQGSMAAMYPS